VLGVISGLLLFLGVVLEHGMLALLIALFILACVGLYFSPGLSGDFLEEFDQILPPVENQDVESA